MRILFVTPYVPSSVRIRPFAFIRELSRLGHQVTLACLVQPKWEGAYLPEVAPYCEAVHPVYLDRFEPYLHTLASLPTKTPLSVAYCRSTKFEQLVRGLVQQGSFDLLHTEFVRAGPVTAQIDEIPKTYDAVDSLSLAYNRGYNAPLVPFRQRMISLIEWIKMRGYEINILSKFDSLLVSSPVDQKALQKNGCQIKVLPNGVDLDYFSFQKRKRDSDTIIFLGKMSYYVNVASVLWFYNEVFPHIRRNYPNVKFMIVGREPDPRIIALATDPAVDVTGTVDDVRPYLVQAKVSICPMVCGSGIQNKMLEAMAVGAPCVATSLATQGLHAKPGRDVLMADGAEAFAEEVVLLLQNEQLNEEIGVNARYYVEQHHHWEQIGNDLDKFFRELLESHQ